MLASFSAELMKLGKRPATWVLAGVWLTMLVFFAYLLPYLTTEELPAGQAEQSMADTLPAGLVGNAVAGYALFGGALALILGALVAGSEYGWGTVKTVLTQGPGRLTVFGGMLAGLAVAMLGMVLLTFVVSAGASAVVASIESAPMDWPDALDIAQGIGSGWLLLGMWCLFGVLLGMATRGTAMAIGLGLVWVLVVEGLIRASATALDFLDVVQKALPGVNGGSLVASLGARTLDQGGAPGVSTVVSGAQAAVVVAVFVVAFALVAGALQRRRDIA